MDSDDDDSYSPIRPVLPVLPTIGDTGSGSDDTESQADDEPEIVFSNIAWAEGPDQAPKSPGQAVCAQSTASPSGGKHYSVGHARPADEHTNAHTSSTGHIDSGRLTAGNKAHTVEGHDGDKTELKSNAVRSTARGHLLADDVEDPSHPQTRVPTFGSARTTPPASPAQIVEVRGSESKDDVQSAALHKPQGPYAGVGRGWLSGAAGRLADTTAQRAMRVQGASDAQQVASAAQASSELAAVQGAPSPSGQQQQEQELSRRFYDIVQEAEAEPLPSSAGLSLEASVMLGMDDLDALIARLRAGAVDLGTGPSSSSGGSSYARAFDLPAADTLWSDEEEERAQGGRGSATAQASLQQEPRQPLPVATKLAAATPADLNQPHNAPPAPASAVPSAAMAPARKGSQPSPKPTGPLPAKFKMFNSLPEVPAVAVGGGAASASGSGPVTQDLRQEVAALAQRHAQATAQQQRQQAHAGSGSGSDEDDEDWMRQRARVKKQQQQLTGQQGSPSNLPASKDPKALNAAQAVERPAAVSSSSAVKANVRPAEPTTVPTSTSSTAGPGAAALAKAKPAAAGVPQPTAAALLLDHAAAAAAPGPTATAATASMAAAAAYKAAPPPPSSPPSVTSTSVATGTDTSDLPGPATRSMFVCTDEAMDEQQRLADIRSYMQARQAKQAPHSNPNSTAVAADGGSAEGAPGEAACCPARPARQVATFSGGDDGADVPAGPQQHPLQQPLLPARASMQCSTEGDEDLLAEPPASTVVHASRERGAHLAPAGVRINFAAHAKASGASLSSSSASAGQPQPVAAAAARATAVPVSLANGGSAAAMPSPPAPISPPPAPRLGGDLPLRRLPAWLQPSNCFTLTLATPNNLTTLELGLLMQWALCAAAASGFSVVSSRLVGLAQGSPLLGTAAASFDVQRAAGAAAAGASPPQVRALALACVPCAGLDPDAYCHAAVASVTADDVRRAMVHMEGLLARTFLGDILQQHRPQLDAGNGVAATARTAIKPWAGLQAGAALFSPMLLHPPAGGASPCTTPTPAGSGAARASQLGGEPTPPSASTPSTGAAGRQQQQQPADVFVCCVTAGVLAQPQLLASLLLRARSMGLVASGLQVVYASEEAAAALAAWTPHRPQPFCAALLLALSGHGGAVQRWHAQLGPADPEVAARAEPASLHALYGRVARHISASFDLKAASREMQLLFGSSGSSTLGAQDGGASAACAAVVTPPPQQQWLALPAHDSAQQFAALWAMHHSLWCGYTLQSLLMCHVSQHDGPGAAAPRNPASGSAFGSVTAAGSGTGPLLVVVLSKEEAGQQLGNLLAGLSPPAVAAAAAAAPAPGMANGISAHGAVRSVVPSDVLQSMLLPSDLRGLPQAYMAQELLAAALPTSERDALVGGPSASVMSDEAALPQHGVDQLAVVAMQSKPMGAAAMALVALMQAACCSSGQGGLDAAAAPASPGDRLELVACRYLLSVPQELAHRLAPVSAPPASHAATAALRPAQKLVTTHPTLLAVFHGPDAQATLGRLLQATQQRLGTQAAVSHGPAATADAAAQPWPALEHLLSAYPPAQPLATPPAQPHRTSATGSALAQPPHPQPRYGLVTAISSSQLAAKAALAHAFLPSQVQLDPTMHDGLRRPALPATAAAGTALRSLLSGPHAQVALLGVGAEALAKNVLPRLLRLLAREGYRLLVARDAAVPAQGRAAEALPTLGGQAAVVVLMARSNAGPHLQRLLEGMGAAAAGVSVAVTLARAQAGAWELWPMLADGGSVAAGSLPVQSAARRLSRPAEASSRLQQLTSLLVLPSKAAGAAGGPGCVLDLCVLADCLEELSGRNGGFRLAGLNARPLAPADLPEVAKACRLSAQHHAALHAAITAAEAEAASASDGSAGSGLWLEGDADAAPPCLVCGLALARDNAVSTLTMRMAEALDASRRQQQGVLQGAAAAGGARALAAVAGLVVVPQSAAAAEQMVLGLFDGLRLGAGFSIAGTAN